MATFDDGPRVRPIPFEGDGPRVRPIPFEDAGPRVRLTPIEDAEKVAQVDSRPGDRADEGAAKGPWLSIGQRFAEGCPYPEIT